MDYLFLYGLQILSELEELSVFLFLTAAIAGSAMLLYAISCADMFTEDTKCYKSELKVFNTLKKIAIYCVVGLLIFSFIPTKQTAILMGGYYYGKKVVTNERIEKVNKLIDAELDERIKEIKEIKEQK